MIGIYCDTPAAMLPFTRHVGLPEHRIRWNSPGSRVTLRCTHASTLYAYVLEEHGKFTIHCPPPAKVYARPILGAFLSAALKKAIYLDSGDAALFSEFIHPPTTAEDAITTLSRLQKAPELSIDLELDMQTGACLSIGFAGLLDGLYEAISIPFTQYNASYWSQEEESRLWLAVVKLCASDTPKVFQNFIFDTLWLSKWGIQVNGPIYDTLVESHLWNPELPKSLADLGAFYLVAAPWKNDVTFLGSSSLWTYNAKDAARTLAIHRKLLEYISTKPQMANLLNNQLVPLSTAVLRLCERGWTVDSSALANITAACQAQVQALTSELDVLATPLLPPKVTYILRKGPPKANATYVTKVEDAVTPFTPPPDCKKLSSLGPVYERKLTKRVFNPGSSDHVKAVLQAMGLTLPQLRGKATTDKRALRRLQDKYKIDFPKKLEVFRQENKILTTYCAVTLDTDSKLRFSLNIAGTVTGRFSSQTTSWGTGFNSQNIPRRFRKIVIPSSPDKLIWNVDFKQADPHIVAWLSGEEKILTELRRPGGDLHALTGSLIVGHDITKTPGYNKDESYERKLGKILNNGLNYGAGAKKLAAEAFHLAGIKLSDAEARTLHAKYFAAYPQISKWHERTERQLLKNQSMETPFGRRRVFYGNYHDKNARAELVRQALAYVPPTTVADATNCAWLRFESLVRQESLTAVALQQCHDSLMGECTLLEWPRVKQLLTRAYESVIFHIGDYQCLLPIDISAGPNWGELK